MKISSGRTLSCALFAVALAGACAFPSFDPANRLRDFEIGVALRTSDAIGFVRDDAGDHSFVRQAVPVLLGRKVRGHDELKVFADLIRERDRATFLRMLLDRDSPYRAEYVDHWTEVFVERLRVHRESDKIMVRSGNSCYRPRRSGAPAGGLAGCIAGSASPATDCRGSGARPFSMGDVLRSSIAADNLAPAYRAHLFALVAHPALGDEITEANRRDDLAATFGHVYLHRNLSCLGCHNTDYSVSGEFDINSQRSYWNRHHPIPGAFETALFGAPGKVERPHEIHAVLRTDVRSSGVAPWQMSDCGSFVARSTVADDPERHAGAPFDAFFTRNLGRRGSVWELEETLREGQRLLRQHGLRRDRLRAAVGPSCTDHCVGVGSPPAPSSPPASVANAIAASCGASCHSAAVHLGGLDLSDAAGAGVDWVNRVVSEPAHSSLCAGAGMSYLIVPGRPEQSCLNHLVQTDQMPTSGAPLSSADKSALSSWISGLAAGAGCDPGEPSICMAADNDNAAAFAYLTAANVVNQVWDEVMGTPLTIPNYFPRNAESRDLLQNLTEIVFIANDWSLKELLIRILTSDHFNRRAPDSTALGSAYAQPPTLKPFEVNDPRFPPESIDGWRPGDPAPRPDFLHLLFHYRNEDGRSRHRNAVGDGVYRYGARPLLRAVHSALGWDDAPRAASAVSVPATGEGPYPDNPLRKALGEFFHDAEPGFRGVGFQALLAWEAHQGLCANKGSTPDWIDRVVSAVRAAKPGTYTQRDLAVTVRDWLIADGTIATAAPVGETDSEEALLQTLFGNLDANADASTAAARSALGGRLRALCGALLESPQFLLAGIAPEGLSVQPRLRVCLDGALCSYREICSAMGPAVFRVLDRTPAFSTRRDLVLFNCADLSLSITVIELALPGDSLCTKPACTVMPGGPQLEPCLKEPWRCMPDPPPCRPGCERIDCCGGPLPPPFELPRYLLAWAEGGRIELARGVRLYRDRSPQPQPLEVGMQLKPGDWLELPPGAELRVVADGYVFRTPKGGMPRPAVGAAQYLQVTGPSVLQANDPANRALRPPKALIERAIRAPEPLPNALRKLRGEAREVGAPRPLPPTESPPMR
jgi:hypothetical protein